MSGEQEPLNAIVAEARQETPPPTPAPATETQNSQESQPTQPMETTEPETDAEKWRKYLEQFPDAKTATKAIKQKAAETGWSVGTGYRAVKQIKKFKDPAAQKAKVPTFRINKAEPMQIFTESEQTQNQTQEIPAPATSQVMQNPPPSYAPAPATAELTPDSLADLRKVIKRNAAKTVNNVFEIVGKRAGITQGSQNFLDADDTEDLGILLPYIIADITQSQMTPETTKKTAYGAYAFALVTKAIKNRMENKTPEPPRRENPPQPAPTPAPTTETPTAEPTQEPPAETHDSKVSWKKQLPS